MNDPGGESISDSVGSVPQVSKDEAGLGPMLVVGVLRKVYMKSSVGWVSAGVAGRMLQTM
jgi:hypothetical protein